MDSLPARKASRQDRKSDAVRLTQVDPSLRNPGLALPLPQAATDTPAQQSRKDKDTLAGIEDGSLVLLTKREFDKLNRRTDDAEKATQDAITRATNAEKAIAAAKASVPISDAAKAAVKAEDAAAAAKNAEAKTEAKAAAVWAPNTPQS